MAKLDIAEHENDNKRVGTITAFLPFVSAKKPHRCELTITPIRHTELRIPFWVAVSAKSQATGITKQIPSVSKSVDVIIIPEIPIRV